MRSTAHVLSDSGLEKLMAKFSKGERELTAHASGDEMADTVEEEEFRDDEGLD